MSSNEVMIAMSGGVDSSICAYLLLKSGYKCSGVFMITNDGYQEHQIAAKRIAERLKIKLHILDFREEFEKILEYFCDEYSKGRTPNPCVPCNRQIKFGKLWDFARRNGAAYLSTGHYARVLNANGVPELYEGKYHAKEQSYFLAMVRRQMLSHIILPMGEYSKEQTRQKAEKLGFNFARDCESQEICFLPKDWVSVLERRCPEVVREGEIIDTQGEVIGTHKGVHQYTIGQRRGLGVAMGKPCYVTKIDAMRNIVTLGPKEEVMKRSFSVKRVNWLIDAPTSAFRGKVKIRYNSYCDIGTIYPGGEITEVGFDEPVSAITPGQLAVFYLQEESGNKVAGGGWIEKVLG